MTIQPEEQAGDRKLERIIEYTHQQAFVRKEDICQLAREAHAANVRSIVVYEPWRQEAQDCLYRLPSPVSVSPAISFPFGDKEPAEKARDIKVALLLGCTGADVITNFGLLKDGDISGFEEEVEQCLTALQRQLPVRSGYAIKFCLETAYLTGEEVAAGARAIAAAARKFPQAHVFVSTSTGFATLPYTPTAPGTLRTLADDVLIIKEAIDETTGGDYVVGIKAAGQFDDPDVFSRIMGISDCRVLNGGGCYRFRENYQRLLRIGTTSLSILR